VPGVVFFASPCTVWSGFVVCLCREKTRCRKLEVALLRQSEDSDEEPVSLQNETAEEKRMRLTKVSGKILRAGLRVWVRGRGGGGVV
jgi:hypothetical protein